MPMISQKDLGTLKDRLRRELKRDVSILLYTQRTAGLTIPGRECQHCDDTQKLMEELTGLSPKLHLEVKDFYTSMEEAQADGVQRIPALVLGADRAKNVRYFGIPLGFEFAAMLDSLVTLSRGVSPLALETRKRLKRLKEDVHIQVFVTPTCQYCPQVARLAHAMAMETPRLSADVIEVQEFPVLGRRYLVSGVPRTVINETVQFAGAVPEATFVDKVLEAVGIMPQEGQRAQGGDSGPQSSVSL